MSSTENRVERTETSVEQGRRVAKRAEPRMLIDGELAHSATGEEFDNFSPATGLVLGQTAEVGCPVMITQSAQLDWPLAEALRYPRPLIEEFEWERTLDGGGLFGERNVRTVVKEPVGVVAAITPSNFPMEVILNKLGPALAAGNTVVLKPDPNTPWNATRLGRLIVEHTDIPAGVMNVVPTPSNDVAGLLGTDPRVDMISFTGSTAVGKLLMRQGADTMKRMFLELGGKSGSSTVRCSTTPSPPSPRRIRRYRSATPSNRKPLSAR